MMNYEKMTAVGENVLSKFHDLDKEEVVQNAFEKYLMAPEPPKGNVLAYFGQTVKFCALEYLKKKKQRARREVALEYIDNMQLPNQSTFEIREHLSSVLTDKQLNTVRAFERGYTAQEIAEKRSVSARAIYALRARAKRRVFS